MHFNLLFPGPVNFLGVCLSSFKWMFSFVSSSWGTSVTSAPVSILKLMVPFCARIFDFPRNVCFGRLGSTSNEHSSKKFWFVWLIICIIYISLAYGASFEVISFPTFKTGLTPSWTVLGSTRMQLKAELARLLRVWRLYIWPSLCLSVDVPVVWFGVQFFPLVINGIRIRNLLVFFHCCSSFMCFFIGTTYIFCLFQSQFRFC